MNPETLVMKELTLAVYVEQYASPNVQYLNHLRKVMQEQGYSLERAIVELFEVQMRAGLLNGILGHASSEPKAAPTRDKLDVVASRWQVGGNRSPISNGKSKAPPSVVPPGFVSRVNLM
jgi:hypothetical protein